MTIFTTSQVFCRRFSIIFRKLNTRKPQCQYLARCAANLKQNNTNLSNKNGSNTVTINELQLRYIYVRTCVDFWIDVPIGVLFDTAYLDSHPTETVNPDIPVLVALHDTPGSIYDLIPVLQPFCNIGYRVIIPSFPGSMTRGMGPHDNITFTGKTDERVVFIHDFLANLRIDRIDLLIGHGTGCNAAITYTASQLQSKYVKSLALINPMGHRPSRTLIDYPAIIEFDELYNRFIAWNVPLKMSLFYSAYTKFKFLKKFPNKERMKIMLHLAGFQFEVLSGDSSVIGMSTIPRLLIYSPDAKWLDSEVMEEFTDILDIPKSNISHCGSDGKITEPENNNTALKCVIFEEADSFIEKYRGHLTLLLQDLLRNVIKKK